MPLTSMNNLVKVDKYFEITLHSKQPVNMVLNLTILKLTSSSNHLKLV